MKKMLDKIFKKAAPKNDFSDFFNHATVQQKRELFREVIKKANEDQKAVVVDASN